MTEIAFLQCSTCQHDLYYESKHNMDGVCGFASLKLCVQKEINFFCCFLVTLLNPTCSWFRPRTIPLAYFVLYLHRFVTVIQSGLYLKIEVCLFECHCLYLKQTQCLFFHKTHRVFFLRAWVLSCWTAERIASWLLNFLADWKTSAICWCWNGQRGLWATSGRWTILDSSWPVWPWMTCRYLTSLLAYSD